MTALVLRVRALMDSWKPYDPDRLNTREDGIEPIVLEEHSMRKSAVRVILLFFVGFVLWAALAPLDAGVVVPGSVKVSGSRKAVQHPSGGVVTAILVREGAVVQQGQVVVRVNPLATQANLSAAESEYIKLLTMESRLRAERVGGEIQWSPELDGIADRAGVAQAKAIQLQLFRSRVNELDSQVRAVESTLRSIGTVLSEKKGQLALVAQESSSVIQLAKEGFVPEARANEMRRVRSNLEVEIATHTSQLNSAQQQLSQLRSVRLKEIDTELSEIQRLREATQLRVRSLDFERNLSEVKAPVAGVVVELKVNTVGGVIGSGQVLMEIVPNDASLIVEAKVPVSLIDKVQVGLHTDMRFSAFNQITTPVIPGFVQLVGADKVSEPNGGEFYLARIETTPEGKAMLKDRRIQPGMPVETVIKTGERTFLTYLFKPLSDRMARSFKD